MNLVHRNIVITGGTAGIGRELVNLLHPNNRVLVIASSRDRLERLSGQYPGLLACRADLSAGGDVAAAAEEARHKLGSIDLLINNAAVQHEPTLTDPNFSYASIRQEIAVNFAAVCELTAMLLPVLMQEQNAAIVNVNSGLALRPKTTSAVYCATKAAINSFSQSLRYQLEGTNVRVLQAFVPLAATRMTEGRGSDKMSASDAACAILRGIEAEIRDHDIGKVRILRLLLRIAPGIASRIMKAA